MELIKKGFAEFMGTAVLVFFACGTAIVTSLMGFNDVVATSLAFGLVLIAMAYSIGYVSGCHINPAVSLAMLLAKRISLKEFLIYILAQILGAIAGAAVLFSILRGQNQSFSGGASNFAINTRAGGYIASIALEIILSFVFIYAVLAVTRKKQSPAYAGAIIGLVLTLVHLIGINLTGTSVNPARSFGPALMTWAFGGGTLALEQIWIFLIAPLAGGALAALVNWCFNKNSENGKEDEREKKRPYSSNN